MGGPLALYSGSMDDSVKPLELLEVFVALVVLRWCEGATLLARFSLGLLLSSICT